MRLKAQLFDGARRVLIMRKMEAAAVAESVGAFRIYHRGSSVLFAKKESREHQTHANSQVWHMLTRPDTLHLASIDMDARRGCSDSAENEETPGNSWKSICVSFLQGCFGVLSN